MKFYDPRLPERIWEKVQPCPMSGCWLWSGTTGKGYGHVRLHGKIHMAHRVFFLASGQGIAEGLQVDHLCRIRCCVNPDHLEAVTSKENNRRRPVVRSFYRERDRCKNGHVFDEQNTRIRAGARFARECRQCERDKGRARRRVRSPEAT